MLDHAPAYPARLEAITPGLSPLGQPEGLWRRHTWSLIPVRGLHAYLAPDEEDCGHVLLSCSQRRPGAPSVAILAHAIFHLEQIVAAVVCAVRAVLVGGCFGVCVTTILLVLLSVWCSFEFRMCCFSNTCMTQKNKGFVSGKENNNFGRSPCHQWEEGVGSTSKLRRNSCLRVVKVRVQWPCNIGLRINVTGDRRRWRNHAKLEAGLKSSSGWRKHQLHLRQTCRK